MLFTDLPFLDRFGAAAEAGFQGVEYLFPYEWPAETLAERLSRHGLENVLFNMPPGNWSAGERGLTCLPGRNAEFRDGVETALTYASLLKVTRLHAMAGIAPAGADPLDLHQTYIANLKYSAAECARRGITLVIEAINHRDMPGFYLNTQRQAWETLQEVNAPNLKMQMDCYHMQVTEGDLATKLRKYAPHCAHIQVAGVPDRHEPDTGEIRYEYIFDLLDEIGFDGWVGCEYRPAGNTVDGLGWYQARRAAHAAI
jgi:2-dehydrotetronate isomerase